MQYLPASNNLSNPIWPNRRVMLSLKPVVYSIPEECFSGIEFLPGPSCSTFHQISSNRAWWTEKDVQ
jgi:hypothetical protein